MDFNETKPESPEFCTDAGSVSNVVRFIDHCWEPDLFVQGVLISHQGIRLAKIILFAPHKIAPLQVRHLLPSLSASLSLCLSLTLEHASSVHNTYKVNHFCAECFFSSKKIICASEDAPRHRKKLLVRTSLFHAIKYGSWRLNWDASPLPLLSWVKTKNSWWSMPKNYLNLQNNGQNKRVKTAHSQLFLSCLILKTYCWITDEPISLSGDTFMCLYNDLGIFIPLIPELVLGNIPVRFFMSSHASENLSVCPNNADP